MIKGKNICGLCCLFIVIMILPGFNGGYAQAKDANPEQTGTKIKKYIYKQTEQGDLEIFIHFPPGWRQQDKRAAIVFFFGGGWRRGKVSQFTYQADYLASRGMITARADYRVKNRHGTLAFNCVEDGKSAVRWLRTNAATLGIDPDRIVASGGSAGAHVAACTYLTNGFEATNEDLKISSKPNLLILFNPVLDARAVKRVRRMGSMDTAIKLSPNLFLTEDTPATILFYGTKDSLLTHGKTFIEKAKKRGIDATLFTAHNVGHGFFNKEPWRNKTLYLADQFLSRHGYVQGQPTLSVSDNAEMLQIKP